MLLSTKPLIGSIAASIFLFAAVTRADTIRIGISAPLTGIQATSGNDVVSHLKAAVEDLNSKGEFGSHRGEIIALDDGYEVSRTKSNIGTLIKDARVHLLLNQIGSAHLAAAIPVIRGTGVTMFAPLSGPSSLYSIDLRPAIVPMRASYADEVKQQIKIFGSMGIRSIALVYQDDAFGQDVLKAWQTFGTEGTVSVRSRYPVARGNESIETEVDGALNSKPDAIVFALVSSPALRAIKYLRTKAPHMYPMLMSVAVTSEVIEASQGANRGTTLFSAVMPLPTTGSSKLLVDYLALRKKYSLKPSFRGLEAYVSLRVVAAEVKKMRTVTPQALGAALSNATSYTVSDVVLPAGEHRFSDVFAITKAGLL